MTEIASVDQTAAPLFPGIQTDGLTEGEVHNLYRVATAFSDAINAVGNNVTNPSSINTCVGTLLSYVTNELNAVKDRYLRLYRNTRDNRGAVLTQEDSQRTDTIDNRARDALECWNAFMERIRNVFASPPEGSERRNAFASLHSAARYIGGRVVDGRYLAQNFDNHLGVSSCSQIYSSLYHMMMCDEFDLFAAVYDREQFQTLPEEVRNALQRERMTPSSFPALIMVTRPITLRSSESSRVSVNFGKFIAYLTLSDFSRLLSGQVGLDVLRAVGITAESATRIRRRANSGGGERVPEPTDDEDDDEDEDYEDENRDEGDGRIGNGVCHPHVSSYSMCLGEGASPIRNNLLRGDFFASFLLINSVLNTYGSSPFLSLSHFTYEPTCAVCNRVISEGDGASCCFSGRRMHAECGVVLPDGRLSTPGAAPSCSFCGDVRSSSEEITYINLNSRRYGAPFSVCEECHPHVLEEMEQAAAGVRMCPSCGCRDTEIGTLFARRSTPNGDRIGRVCERCDSPDLRFTRAFRSRNAPVFEIAEPVACSCGVAEIGLTVTRCPFNGSITVCRHCDPEATGVSSPYRDKTTIIGNVLWIITSMLGDRLVAYTRFDHQKAQDLSVASLAKIYKDFGSQVQLQGVSQWSTLSSIVTHYNDVICCIVYGVNSPTEVASEELRVATQLLQVIPEFSSQYDHELLYMATQQGNRNAEETIRARLRQ